MAVSTAQSKEARRAPLPLTSRRDNWWIKPLTTVLVLSGFVIYTAWRGLENQYYEVGPYLSPFYSPLLPFHWTIFGWNVSPAVYIVVFPLAFPPMNRPVPRRNRSWRVTRCRAWNCATSPRSHTGSTSSGSRL